ncbi:SDR family oxidoreductase [Kutzneria buriramensis]|uniref:NAD(P)-dependent dehydrogenase (Short-subunit alcohol dehydrogenase family) n=1 Tax=Kutzneria buriramensis TaxID=1045776 RepID=A0A3E0HEP2_9PSEU|nr:SDR family oxidoreductase [Kutzneria buriramensis]REH43680.1 NAD(P)-dependent dehydrogenase (short-subunit alcohol dehydrogenase family) [Kutzneria buriramensis]
MGTNVVVGGSHGIGRLLAERAAGRGETVVITSRDKGRAQGVAAEIGGATTGIALDLAAPTTIEAALAEVGEVDHLVITAIEQTQQTIAAFDIADAINSATIKLVGYAETVRVLHGRFGPDASVVLFGGLAKERPYPGSTMVTTINAGVAGLMRTLVRELAPVRVNALHSGVVGDSPKWIAQKDTHPAVARTPVGRLVTMAEVADATEFLLRNGGMNAHELNVDGGWLIS